MDNETQGMDNAGRCYNVRCKGKSSEISERT
jgi:hypothetical protein